MKFLRFWPSAFYFIYFCALTFSPYQVLYFQSLGFSGTEAGLLLALLPLANLVASPFWTGLADIRHQHRNILFVTLLFSILLSALVPLFNSYLGLVLVLSLMAFFSAPHIPLADSATIHMLGDRKDLFGRVRIWGTIGWALSAILAGVVLQNLGLRWVFWGFAIVLSVNLVIPWKLDFPNTVSSASFRHGLHQLLTDRKWILFLLMVLMISIGGNIHNYYLSLLFEDLQAPKSTLGIALTLATFFELPVMFFGGFLLKKLTSKGMLFIILAATGVRSLVYFMAGSTAVLMAAQLLHGFTFPALVLAGVSYASENAPPGLSATAQGVFGAVFMGVGAATASLLGGILIDGLGAAGMFGAFSLAILASLVIFLVVDRKDTRHTAT